VVAWLDEIGVDPARGIVVGRDARRGSEEFNDEAVAVLLGAGLRVFEMPGPLPTPFVAYAVRALHAGAGIMITASHNPPLDNGYKLYAPHDQTVERYAASASPPVLASRTSALHGFVDPEVLARYFDHFSARFAVDGGSDLRVTYTPLHGVGGAPMTELFAAAGFRAVTAVREQFAPDGTFPTLPYPNPEEPGALDLAMACADAASSRLVIANDPDADPRAGGPCAATRSAGCSPRRCWAARRRVTTSWPRPSSRR
jgi:phosphomannomutase